MVPVDTGTSIKLLMKQVHTSHWQDCIRWEGGIRTRNRGNGYYTPAGYTSRVGVYQFRHFPVKPGHRENGPGVLNLIL